MTGIRKFLAVVILAGMVLVPCLAMAEEANTPPAAATSAAPVQAQAPAAPAAPTTTTAAAPAPAPKVDTGDTAGMLISTALVMLMTPGLALFYGGMVRKKNVLGTIMQSFFIVAVISVQWALWATRSPSDLTKAA